MKSFAAQKTFKWLQENGINITTLIHDKNSSTYVAASNAYTNIIEWLCVNHAKGNFYKEFVELGKKYKYLKSWARKAVQHFSYCIDRANNNVILLQ
jgi:hypothetical protein